jgi:transposase
VHLACDRNAIALGVHLSGGHRHEAQQFDALMQCTIVHRHKRRSLRRPKQLVADRGYDSASIRAALRGRRIRAVIPTREYTRVKPKRGRPMLFVKELYRQRNVIERLIAHLKEHRRLATRYEKRAANFRSMILLGCIRLILNKYFPDTA